MPGAGDGTVRGAMREQGRSKTGIPSIPHVKLEPMSAPGPTGERQEHLDAIVSFTGEEAVVSGTRHSYTQVGDK